MERNTLCWEVMNRIRDGVKSTAAFSIYPPAVYITELTTAQAVIAALFHCLSISDEATASLIFSVACDVPQVRSSFLRIWLRDDFQFLRLEVGKCLASLAQLTIREKMSLQSPIVITITGLEGKYGLLGYFSQSLVECTERVYGPSSLQIPIVPCKPPSVKLAGFHTPTEVNMSKYENQKIQPPTKGLWKVYSAMQNKLQSGVKIIKGVTPKLCRKQPRSTPIKKEQDTDAWSIIDELETSEIVLEDKGVVEIHSSSALSDSMEEATEACSHALNLPSVESILVSQQIDFRDTKLEFNFRSIPTEVEIQEAQERLRATAYKNDPLAASKARSAGASPSCSSKWDNIPLHLADSHGNQQAVRLLIAADAEIDCRTDATNKHHNCVHTPHKGGATSNAKDSYGKIPNMLVNRKLVKGMRSSNSSNF